MRFFGGLTGEEIAKVLGISAITVKRKWGDRKGPGCIMTQRRAGRTRRMTPRTLASSGPDSGIGRLICPLRSGKSFAHNPRVRERSRNSSPKVNTILAAHDDSQDLYEFPILLAGQSSDLIA